MISFRTLRADEIECRVAQISDKGLQLLLYKNARVDMDILDETVGAENWQRSHSRDNANCTVSIWVSDEDRAAWVSKEDTGTESNTEAEKGLASDSFKRSCVNWGIGRELYSSPFIWVKATDCDIKDKNGRRSCYDRFKVASIQYDERRRISELVIRNDSKNRIVFEWYAIPKSKAAPATDYAAKRKRLEEITLLLTNGKPEDMRSAYHYWTDSRFVKLSAIPDEEIPAVLEKAESLYRKRNGKDFE